MSNSTHWLDTVVSILVSRSSSLVELSRITGYTPRALFDGTDLSGLVLAPDELVVLDTRDESPMSREIAMQSLHTANKLFHDARELYGLMRFEESAALLPGCIEAYRRSEPFFRRMSRAGELRALKLMSRILLKSKNSIQIDFFVDLLSTFYRIYLQEKNELNSEATKTLSTILGRVSSASSKMRIFGFVSQFFNSSTLRNYLLRRRLPIISSDDPILDTADTLISLYLHDILRSKNIDFLREQVNEFYDNYSAMMIDTRRDHRLFVKLTIWKGRCESAVLQSAAVDYYTDAINLAQEFGYVEYVWGAHIELIDFLRAKGRNEEATTITRALVDEFVSFVNREDVWHAPPTIISSIRREIGRCEDPVRSQLMERLASRPNGFNDFRLHP